MADKITIAELDINLDAIIAKNAQLLAQQKELKDAQSELKKETDNLSTATQEQLETYVKTDAELKKVNGEYNKNKSILAEVQGGVKGLNDALNKEVKTIEQARKNNQELTKARNQVNAKTKEGQEAINQINKKIDENNGFIKDNVSQLEQQKINIGNYASALDKLVPGLGGFINGLQGSVTSMKAATSSTKAFRLALISTGIGAIVVALGLLINGFLSTQKGIDKVNQVLAPLRGAFEALKGVIQDIALNIFDQLADRWTITVGTIQKGINNIRIGWNLVSGDIAEAAELQAENAELTKEIAKAQESLNVKTKAFGEIIDGTNQRLKEGADTQREIERLTIAIEEAQIRSAVPLKKAFNELKKYKQEAEDTSKTENERLIALDKAVERQQEITKIEQGIQDLIIEKARLTNTLNDTDREAEQEYQDLIAKRYELETAGIENLTTLQNLRNTILQTQAREATLQLQNQLKHEEELIKARLVREEELRKEFQTAREYAQNIKFQEDLIRAEEEGASMLALRLMELGEEERIEKEALQRRIESGEASERELTLIDKKYSMIRQQIAIEESRAKFQGIQQVAGNIAELLGEQTTLGKIAALTQATINTYLGASAAFAQTPGGIVIKTLAAASATALGLRNVTRIAGIMVPKFKDGTEYVRGEGTETSDSIWAKLSRGERVVDAKKNRAIGSLSNDQLVQAAIMYKQFQGSSSFSDRGIIGALSETTKAIKSKPSSRTIIQVQEGFKLINKTSYLN